MTMTNNERAQMDAGTGDESPSGNDAPSMDRRVLVLTYYYPPSGGAGVQRALKFTKYLPSVDWTPVILTVREGAYPAQDASLWADVPACADIHRTRSWDPYRLYAHLTGQSRDEAVVQGSVEGEKETWKTRFARWVRANVFLPDARVGWVPFAVWRGWKLLSTGRFDAVLTTGPPHSTHLSGAALQALTGTPWLADFRDPWTDINYYQELPHTQWAQRLDEALERLVLRRAQAITTVSPSWCNLLRQNVERPDRDRFHIVQNGYDEEDVAERQHAVDTDVFSVTHVGSLYSSRNPTALWGALKRLREEDAVPDLRIRLVGLVDPPVRVSLQEHDLDEVTEFVSYVPHDEAVAYMQRAGLLLLSIEDFPAATGMLTGKIYEYLVSGRPVLGVGPPEGDAAALLERTDGGRLFGWTDAAGMASFVRRHYEAWTEGEPRPGARPNVLQPYRRQVQAEALGGVLDEIAA